MNADRIYIDASRLRQDVLAYLRSPAAEPVYKELEMPLLVCFIGAAILFCAGMCMLPTIVWTLAGLQALWTVLKLEPFRPAFDDPRKKPEALVPLIGHGIIIGPDRRHLGVPKRFGLVLGSFQPTTASHADWVTQKAKTFADMYLQPEGHFPQDEAAIRALLADDHYRPNRRRPVPEPQAEHSELLLFDAELEVLEGCETHYGTVLFAFVAEPGETGELIQIPWSVVSHAVSIT